MPLLGFTNDSAGIILDGSNVAAAVATIIGTLVATLVVVGPYLRKLHKRLKESEKTDKAVREVILGRPQGEPNFITGEAGVAKLPGIAERMNTVNDMAVDLATNQRLQTQLLDKIAREIRVNTESRIEKLEDLTEELRTQLRALYARNVLGRDDTLDHHSDNPRGT